MKKLRIKMLEPFKDGNVLGGRFLKAGEILIVDESDAVKIENSGGLIEVVEQVIPNPLKEAKAQEVSSYNEVAPATGEAKPGQTVTKPRGRGRPKK